MKRTAVFAATTAMTALAGVAYSGDFGQQVEQLLNAKANSLFGLNGTLNESSTTQVTGADAEADPRKLVTLARGLTAHVVSKDPALGGNVDQIALWPSDTKPDAPDLLQRGRHGGSGDPARHDRDRRGRNDPHGPEPLRPDAPHGWGTVFAAEENGSASRVVEIIDPLHTTNVTITGTTSAAPTRAMSRCARRSEPCRSKASA